MSETSANLVISEQMHRAMVRTAYEGIVGLGDPIECPIMRCYYDAPLKLQYPMLAIEGDNGCGGSQRVELDAEEAIALYDALTLRIAYLRECAKREGNANELSGLRD